MTRQRTWFRMTPKSSFSSYSSPSRIHWKNWAWSEEKWTSFLKKPCLTCKFNDNQQILFGQSMQITTWTDTIPPLLIGITLNCAYITFTPTQPAIPPSNLRTFLHVDNSFLNFFSSWSVLSSMPNLTKLQWAGNVLKVYIITISLSDS